MLKEPTLTVGIEEEYLLIDPESRDLINEVPDGFFDECQKRLKNSVSPEFLQCQLEIGTPVCRSIAEARDCLLELRGQVLDVAQRFDLAVIAASTHPFATGATQATTEKDRYTELARDLQQVARRLLICGMHVHAGIEDDSLRIDLMRQVTYVLPHLLALSTSSPFWKGDDTGLKSYRISVWDEMPRTGLPEHFDSYAEYQRHVNVLVDAGIIEDGSKVWWDIRPSCRFPTIEMRITDICTRVDDGVCLAALYVCWLRMLYRLRRDNKRWRQYSNFLVDENRWRAHRYGIDEGLIDFGRGTVVPYRDLFEEIVNLVDEDAAFFQCEAEIQRGFDIISEGTSAHRQLAVYRQSMRQGMDPGDALIRVVDHLVDDTRLGL